MNSWLISSRNIALTNIYRIFLTHKTKKDHYDFVEDINIEQLITAAIDRYEVIISPGKWNVM